MLNSSKKITAKQIAEKLELNIRTVYRYIDFLSASGVPIISDSGHNGGYSLMNDYHQAPLVFDIEEKKHFSMQLLMQRTQARKDVLKNKELAIKWLTLLAEQGNEYAKFFLDICISSESLRCTRNFKNDESCGRIFENNVPLPDKSAIGFKVDSKLMRKMREKKVG